MGITSKQRGRQMFPGGIVGLGEWVDVPFNAANFTTGSAMTWTVTAPPVTNRYCRIGNAIVWNVWVTASTLGGTPGNSLLIAPPTPNKVARYAVTACGIIHAGVTTVGLIKANPPVPGAFGISLAPVGTFSLGACQVQFSFTYEYGDPS